MTIAIAPFVEALAAHGVDCFTGVPCSFLQSFVSHAAAGGRLPYTIAASEGEAVALAAGSWLGGRFPALLLQNSGLGNTINPLTSLSLPYELPLLLLVSHRGESGTDAPQHRVMGEVTYGMLELLGLEVARLSTDGTAAAEQVAASVARSREKGRPVVLVVSKGTFEPFVYDRPLAHKRPRPGEVVVHEPVAERPTRSAALAALDGVLAEDDLVVTTTGMTSRELCALRDRPGNFYMVGSMGCAPAIGLGLALSRPARKVVVVDGDGAFLMKMGTAATIGHYAPRGLLHVLLDNGTYASTGGQPTVSSSVSFEGVAAACGYRRAMRVDTPEELAALVAEFRPGDGPVFATLVIESTRAEGADRVARTPRQMRDDFRAAALA